MFESKGNKYVKGQKVPISNIRPHLVYQTFRDVQLKDKAALNVFFRSLPSRALGPSI